ncbi:MULTISPECIES: S24 family peptidase [unclassified Pseudomonas]|uniref:S24 family peptidase n=1 Tax=Pseudomonas TaxID=286 RepID=UPI001EE2E08A|nr:MULTISPECIES: S24 family peptidase [unclassified Pseudomonas]
MEKWIALVKQRMRELGLSQEQLAERVGVTQGGVGHWLRGTRQPKVGMMNQVLQALGMAHLHVSLRMVRIDQLAEPNGAYAAEAGGDDDDLLQYIMCFRYPVLAWTELEGPWPEGCIVYEQTDYPALGKAFWLPVEGDLMSAATGPSVPEQTLVLVDPGVPAAPGKLVIARQKGTSAMFRQLVEDGGQRYLKPLNPTYPKLLCGEDFEVLGVVVRSHGRH